MPNGRTAIFEVETEMLLNALGEIESNKSVGTLFDSELSTSLNVSLAKLMSSVRQVNAPRISIEEQHGCEYIVHTGHPVGGWVCIDQSSPVFPLIRGLHFVKTITPIHDAPRTQSVSGFPTLPGRNHGSPFMKLFRWIAYIPAGILASLIAGVGGSFIGEIAANRFMGGAEWPAATYSGAFSALAFVVVGLNVAPVQTGKVKLSLIVIAACFGAASFLGGFIGENDPLVGFAMLVSAIACLKFPLSEQSSTSQLSRS
jgi:hypothetical protein